MRYSVYFGLVIAHHISNEVPVCGHCVSVLPFGSTFADEVHVFVFVVSFEPDLKSGRLA